MMLTTSKVNLWPLNPNCTSTPSSPSGHRSDLGPAIGGRVVHIAVRNSAPLGHVCTRQAAEHINLATDACSVSVVDTDWHWCSIVPCLGHDVEVLNKGGCVDCAKLGSSRRRGYAANDIDAISHSCYGTFLPGLRYWWEVVPDAVCQLGLWPMVRWSGTCNGMVNQDCP